MSRLLITSLFFLAINTFSVIATADSATFNLKTVCKATLTSGNETFYVKTESSEFAPTIEGFSNSISTLNLGPYTLNVGLIMNQPFGSSSMEPTLYMNLFEGNPIQGIINNVRVQGLEIESRVANVPLSLYGTNFLNFVYNGKPVSRVDYSCSLTKVN